MKNDNILTAGCDKRNPTGRSPLLSVVFPADMLQKIRRQASKNDISAGELVRRLCADGLKRGVS